MVLMCVCERGGGGQRECMVYACERERERGCESAGELCNLSILCLLSPPPHTHTPHPLPGPLAAGRHTSL